MRIMRNIIIVNPLSGIYNNEQDSGVFAALSGRIAAACP